MTVPANWQPYNLQSIFPGAVEPVVSTFNSVSNTVGSALGALASALDTLAALLLDISDPLKAAIDALIAAIEQLQAAIFDALNSGLYFYMDGGPALTGGTPDGLSGFYGRFEASFYDLGDKYRPQFSDTAQVSALILVGGANDLPSLANLMKLFGELFGIEAFLKAWENFQNANTGDDYPTLIERGMSTPPDWKSIRLGDYIPPLDKLQEILSQIIGLLKTASAFSQFLKDLAAALKEKADLLLAISAEIKAILDMLLALLLGAGLYALPVVGASGIPGLIETVHAASNPPPFDRGAFVSGVVLLAGTADFSPIQTLFGV